ncbi:MAG: sigma-54 dependent transcriptional regulator [Chthoniobacteraceae bacterium]|nr:sigma-54 dependent transcriptional regulator [Chthoniobacteraceae bacterium]
MGTQEKAATQAAERKILVIDDDRVIQVTLAGWLGRHGFRVSAASTAAAGLAALAREEPDVVLLDLGLPDAGGLETLNEIHARQPQAAVIIVTAQDSLDNAIESIKRGAFHFISKPYVPEELLSLVRRAAEKRELVRETAHLRNRAELLSRRLEEAQQQLQPGCSNGVMKEVDALIRRVAPSDSNVFLIGESGVGKEVMANRIHRLSRRSDRTMIRLNCAAFPANLIEGELFGYVKGAFTGAVADFPGMIAQAEGGTLFLDEIVEMPADLQTRFLRVLQEREFRALGSTRTVQADFRLIAATNRPVADAVRDGLLRRDLYYRINTFQIEIPPLRERKEDIPALVTAFLNQFACRLGKPPPQIAPEAFARLASYDWPGNIRELQNAIEYGVVLACGGRITEKELPKELFSPTPSATPEGGTLNLDTLERNAILLALGKTSGNKKKAAQLLGIHRPTLYSKMKRHRIPP